MNTTPHSSLRLDFLHTTETHFSTVSAASMFGTGVFHQLTVSSNWYWHTTASLSLFITQLSFAASFNLWVTDYMLPGEASIKRGKTKFSYSLLWNLALEELFQILSCIHGPVSVYLPIAPAKTTLETCVQLLCINQPAICSNIMNSCNTLARFSMSGAWNAKQTSAFSIMPKPSAIRCWICIVQSVFPLNDLTLQPAWLQFHQILTDQLLDVGFQNFLEIFCHFSSPPISTRKHQCS